jgi:hypothetical protein
MRKVSPAKASSHPLSDIIHDYLREAIERLASEGL